MPPDDPTDEEPSLVSYTDPQLVALASEIRACKATAQTTNQLLRQLIEAEKAGNEWRLAAARSVASSIRAGCAILSQSNRLQAALFAGFALFAWWLGYEGGVIELFMPDAASDMLPTPTE